MDFYIKKVESFDWKILQTVSIATFKATYETKNDPSEFAAYLAQAFAEKQLKKELANPASDFYFAYQKKQLVGYFKINEAPAQTDLNETTSLEIERIYLKEEYQGMGLGRRMIEEAVKIANERAKAFVWLGVWIKNPDAIAFYKKVGFIIFGEHIFRIGEDDQKDYLMRLDL